MKKNVNLSQNVINIYYAIPEWVDEEILLSKNSTKIIFKTNFNWDELPVSKKAIKFREVEKNTIAGKIFDQSIDAFMPGEDDINNDEVNLIAGRPVLIKIVYSNHKNKLIGSLKGSKPKLSTDFSVGSGKTGTKIKIKGKDIHRAHWLED